MGHGGSKSCREKSCRYTFFRKSPRVESQQQATEGKGGDVRGATCHNSGMKAHRHGEERGDAELIVYARGSEIKGGASHGQLVDGSFVHRHLVPE